MTHWTMLHGLNNDAAVWNPVVGALAPESAYTPDLPPYETVEEIADAVAAPMKRGVLVGHSFGGAVAMAVLDRHPDKVDRLVLVAPSVGVDTPGQAQARVAKADGVRTVDEYVEAAVALMPRVFHPDMLGAPGLETERRRSVRSYGLERYRAHNVAIGSRADRDAVVAQFGRPILVVAAADDRVIPLERLRAFSDATGADFRVLEHAGHMAPAECPHRLAELLSVWAEPGTASP